MNRIYRMIPRAGPDAQSLRFNGLTILSILCILSKIRPP